MHRRHENLPILAIHRTDFIFSLIVIQQNYDLPFDLILIVLEAADRFINKKSSHRYYSEALAYSLFILVEKYNIDHPGLNIKDISDTLGTNLAVLEREIFPDIDFLFQRYNVFSFITLFILPIPEQGNFRQLPLGDQFYHLLLKIANNNALMYANPRTLLLAIVMLIRKNKFRLSAEIKMFKPFLLLKYLKYFFTESQNQNILTLIK